jgi:hypothetical protein
MDLISQWVNRYGYLGDPKLESIRMLLGAGASAGGGGGGGGTAANL